VCLGAYSKQARSVTSSAIGSVFESVLGSMLDISKMYFSHWEPPGVSERM
jgi:hypothetical protein